MSQQLNLRGTVADVEWDHDGHGHSWIDLTYADGRVIRIWSSAETNYPSLHDLSVGVVDDADDAVCADCGHDVDAHLTEDGQPTHCQDPACPDTNTGLPCARYRR